MQDDPRANFQRAINTTPLAELGDPERWGSIADVAIAIPPNFVGVKTAVSDQLVRAQVPQLAARQWVIFGSYLITATDPLLTWKIVAEIRAGVGQATLKLPAQLFPPPNVQTPFTLAASATEGANELATVPGAAIAVRYSIEITVGAPGLANPLVAQVQVGASAAPRAL